MSDQSSDTDALPTATLAGEVVEAPLQPIPEYVEELVTQAKRASNRLATLSTSVKNQALLAMADALEAQSEVLLAANDRDVEAFGSAPEKQAMADRLRLTPERITDMASGLREVAKLPDPLEGCQRCGPGRTACKSAVCGFRSASLELFMSLAPM